MRRVGGAQVLLRNKVIGISDNFAQINIFPLFLSIRPVETRGRKKNDWVDLEFVLVFDLIYWIYEEQ